MGKRVLWDTFVRIWEFKGRRQEEGVLDPDISLDGELLIYGYTLIGETLYKGDSIHYRPVYQCIELFLGQFVFNRCF